MTFPFAKAREIPVRCARSVHYKVLYGLPGRRDSGVFRRGVRLWRAGGWWWEAFSAGLARMGMEKRRADLTWRFAVIRFSLRGPSGMGGQRRAAVGAARQARVVWLMTSSTKLSSRFCRPSPISKRVKLTTRNLPPIICLTEMSGSFTNGCSMRQTSL